MSHRDTVVAVVVLLAVIVLFVWISSVTPENPFDPVRSEESNESDSTSNGAGSSNSDIRLATTTLTSSAGEETPFWIAEPFEMTVAAENLGKVRFMTMSPDGRLFVPDLVDYLLSHDGKIYILDDFNEETGRFETKHTYLEDLRGPNSLDFYTDEDGRQWLYIALTAHIVRYPYETGDTAPSGAPEIVFEFPNTQAPNAQSVVWHITRTIEFQDDRLYVTVGSGCDACEQPAGEMRGMLFSMDPDGGNTEIHADGLRNSVGFTWANDEIFVTANGMDRLGPNGPDEKIYRVIDGTHYGWPYCYELNGEVRPNNTVAWERPVQCSEVPRSFTAFEPHSAPLGIEYFEDAHPVLDGHFLVALHGSFDPDVRAGYQVMRVSEDGEQEIFMDGFQDDSGARYARPLDFLQADEDSFFMTDDFGGRVYYVSAES